MKLVNLISLGSNKYTLDATIGTPLSLEQPEVEEEVRSLGYPERVVVRRKKPSPSCCCCCSLLIRDCCFLLLIDSCVYFDGSSLVHSRSSWGLGLVSNISLYIYTILPYIYD